MIYDSGISWSFSGTLFSLSKLFICVKALSPSKQYFSPVETPPREKERERKNEIEDETIQPKFASSEVNFILPTSQICHCHLSLKAATESAPPYQQHSSYVRTLCPPPPIWICASITLIAGTLDPRSFNAVFTLKLKLSSHWTLPARHQLDIQIKISMLKQ